MSVTSSLKNYLFATALEMVAFVALFIHLGHSRADAQNGFGNDNNGAQDEKLAIEIGYAVAPVTPNTAGLDADLVGLGSYIGQRSQRLQRQFSIYSRFTNNTRDVISDSDSHR